MTESRSVPAVSVNINDAKPAGTFDLSAKIPVPGQRPIEIDVSVNAPGAHGPGGATHNNKFEAHSGDKAPGQRGGNDRDDRSGNDRSNSDNASMDKPDHDGGIDSEAIQSALTMATSAATTLAQVGTQLIGSLMTALTTAAAPQLQQMLGTLGSGTPAPGTPAANLAQKLTGLPSPNLTGDTNDAYKNKKKQLSRTADKFDDTQKQVNELVKQNGETVENSRKSVTNTISEYTTQAAALRPIKNTPVGQLALLNAYHTALSNADSTLKQQNAQSVATARKIGHLTALNLQT